MLLWALLLLAVSGRWCGAELQTWVFENTEDFAQGSTQGVQVHPDSLVILGQLQADENVALGRTAVDEFDKTVPLSDGSIALVRSEWLSGTPNVFGRNFTVDLGLDRAINRVRVLAGESAINLPEYFVRGYRLEAATQNAPEVWHLLAEESANFVLNTDTDVDATWDQTDAQGRPVAQQGRYVRLTLIRQDRTNWVAIGEIEVYGMGYGDQGTIEDRLIPSRPVNVGQIRWNSHRPPRTEIDLQMRGTTGGQALAWDELTFHTEDEFLFDGAEPVDMLEYRVNLANTAPFVTPALERLEVDYDLDLVAQRILGEVTAPARVAKGVAEKLTYRVELDVAAGDHGVDLLRLDGPAMEIKAVRLDGRELDHDTGLEQGYRWSNTFDPEGTFVELAPEERIVLPSTVEIEGEALFVRDKTPVELVVGSAGQSQRDGYTNWQQGQEAPGGSWTVLASGAPLSLLGKVEVSPKPFSPFAEDGTAQFEFVVGNIEAGKQIIVEIFSLDGRRLRRLQQAGQVRRYRVDWDGRDERGGLASPGLYLYEVRVEGSDAGRRGTFVVAY
ncbi:MAG: hypothetical protein GKR89_16530 [Candidatus Latescibacteria bacterium]|nr:hypothetical protein [Candidatus Latescibacterota bacterium]